MPNVSERTLDRIPQFDVKSRAYAIRSLLESAVPKDRLWRVATNTWLDQGKEGACVGFGWTNELGATPIRYKIDQALAQRIYQRARQLDDWEGEDYDGTSVLAGAKAATEYGFLKEYRWAFGLHDVLIALSYKGPVVLGVNWYEGMFDTDANGFIRVAGDLSGGHCILAYAIDTNEKTVTLRNSWGREWGTEGSCKLTWADLERLLAEQGEACLPIDASQRRAGITILDEDDHAIVYERETWWDRVLGWLKAKLHL